MRLRVVQSGFLRCCLWSGLILLRALTSSATVSTPAQLNAALGTNAQAVAISLAGVDPLSCPQVSMSQTWSGGKLIFSDSPESPSTTGILYIDTNLTATATGSTNRLFVYHVNNNSTQSLRFSVLIKNNGTSSGILTVQRASLAGPSTDYAYAGEVCFSRWLGSSSATGVSVAAGQVVRLDTTFDTINVAYGNLLHGIWDYTFTQPHSVIICALNPTDNPITVGPTLPVLARDGHERGTFAACNKLYSTASGVTINTSAGIQQYPIAGNGDTYVTGADNAVSPATLETNTGNYGVLYNLQMATAFSDGRALGLVINPRGGAWCGAISVAAGLFPGGTFLVPAGDGTLSDGSQAVIAGGFAAGSTISVSVPFMPTGGASFPLRLVAVPYNAVRPTLAAIGNYTVNPGQTVSFTGTASDANPNVSLKFSLSNNPAGAVIGATSGLFQWRPPVANAASTNTMQVIVADSSTPPQTTNRIFAIVVNPLAPTKVTTVYKTVGQVQFQVTGTIGPDYILQGSTNLANAGGWVNLATNTPTAAPFSFVDTNAAGFSNRFYRFRLAP